MNQSPTKGQRIQAMFDSLAPRYDLMNRLMTLGQDQRWRRFVAKQATDKPGSAYLDLASGTGDIAFELKRLMPEAEVFAADFSLGMLQQGKTRPKSHLLHWIACDALHLPFQDNSFDAVTFGYLLRNVTDMDQALCEIYRVLKPNGRVVCLDTSPPPPGPVGPMVRAYCRFGLPLLGRLVAKDASSYAYLSASTFDFEDPKSLQTRFEKNGFQKVTYRTFMLQTIAVHWGNKPTG